MATVISSGQLVEIRRPWASTVNTYGSLRMYGEYHADYAAIYRTQPNVRRVVSFLARNMAQIGIKAYGRVSDVERRHLPDHPCAALLRNPNPHQTRFKFMQALVSDLAIYDNVYIVKIRRAGKPVLLLPVPPTWVTFDGKTPFWSSNFWVTVGATRYRIPDEDLIHMHGYHPTDPRTGLSPLEALRRTLAEEDASGRFREAFWNNSARQEIVIKRPVDAPDWTDEAANRFRKDWQELYSGAENAGKTPVLEDGMDLQAISVSSKDAEYIASRKFSLEEVCGVYHVSPPMVGLLDEANFGSQAELRRQMMTDTLAPWTVELEEEFERQLLSEFEAPGAVYLEFNIQEKEKGSFEEIAKNGQAMVGAPTVTRNEWRARLNLPPVEGGDELITPLNVLIGGQASPQDSAPKGLSVIERHLHRQESVLLKYQGAYAEADPSLIFETDRWDRELTDDLLKANRLEAPSPMASKASQLAQSVNKTVLDCLEAAHNNGAGISQAMQMARQMVLKEERE